MSQHSVKFDEEQRHAVYDRDGYKCAGCGFHDVTKSGAGLSVDHIKAREDGGAAQNRKGMPATNLATLCGPCNSTKQAKTLAQFNKYLQAQGKPPVDWNKVKEQARKPIDIKAGAENAAKAKTFRAETMKRLGLTNVKQLQSVAGKGELQQKLTEHGGGSGPGVCHDPETGQFTACRLAVVRAARDLARVLRARLLAAG